MEGSRIEGLVDEARELFDERAGTVETGLAVDSPDLLQLRKACRLMDAARYLIEEDGYYTVVIEASFAAIERTLQFYLLANDFIDADEFVDHATVYEHSQAAGLYGREMKEKLVGLWRDNRSWSYYREGVGSVERAEVMVALAEAVHSHVLQLGGRKHECICQNTYALNRS